MHEFLRELQLECIKSFPRSLDRRQRAQRLQIVLEILLCYLLILHHIFLIHEIAAHQTILASDAVLQKHRIRAIGAILQKRRSITAQTIDAPVTELAQAHTKTVQTILRSIETVTVVAITVFVGIKDEIAVFIFAGIVRIVAVLIILVSGKKIHMRYRQAKILILLKERSLEIKVSSILHRIPCIRIPDFLIVHFERGIGMNIGDDVIS